VRGRHSMSTVGARMQMMGGVQLKVLARCEATPRGAHGVQEGWWHHGEADGRWERSPAGGVLPVLVPQHLKVYHLGVWYPTLSTASLFNHIGIVALITAKESIPQAKAARLVVEYGASIRKGLKQYQVRRKDKVER
jgi:hypothetical protein